jgi:glycosyltransferase involved in cell wall biosynthesis
LQDKCQPSTSACGTSHPEGPDTRDPALTARIAAIVLTKNEERDLPACLESLSGLAAEIHIIDSGSTDNTIRVADRFGARVLSHDFVNYASQFNWALENIASEADWVLRIDADERVTAQLLQNLMASLPHAPAEVTGFEIARRTRFLGRELHHGDSYPIWLLRIWRRGAGRCEDTWMDEHILLERGRTDRVSGDIIHEIPKDLTEWTAKHNWYATRECKDITDSSEAKLPRGQAGAKRRLKQNVYLRLPPFWRALLYWFYRYFLKLGFLDGTQGLIYHFLQGFWYRFLIDAKLYEKSTTTASARGSRAHQAQR